MSISKIDSRCEVESHVGTHLIHVDPTHDRAYENSRKNGLPTIAVSPAQGKLTSLLVALSGARNVLEIGTLGGYSSIWLARGLQGRGKVTSLEVNPHHRDVAIENMRHAGVKVPEDVEVLLGAGLDVLPKLAQEIKDGKREAFDFVFVDADWDNQWNYFDWGVKLSRGAGSTIYVDNAVLEMLESGIVGPEKRRDDAVDLVKMVGEDSRVEATVLQTVGAKSFDGFLIAVVK
ncbi:hypothetical protein N7456_009334 [Penicillium angulare]|uniref:O-methyltransferase n=1 Tax=Penicillium angulare TaxID=116970 RepID=A0A9W9F4G1_9EURO|nr:hypothetical protein N7456_009334 [Penicillium angulare]